MAALTALLLFLAATAPAVMIGALLFCHVERLPRPQRIGLALIGAGLLLSHPAFPIAFRMLLFGGLTVYLWAAYGPALWRRLAAELDDALEGAHWTGPPPG